LLSGRLDRGPITGPPEKLIIKGIKMAVQKPNYTQLPNRFVDEYMSKVSPGASMVYLVVCRKTIGWQKENDEISLSQIMDLTGLSKSSAIRGVKELEDLNLLRVVRSEKGRKSANCYELIFDDFSDNIEPENSTYDKVKSTFNGVTCEPSDKKIKVNGVTDRPLNPVNGVTDRPQTAFNGVTDRHTKEIVLNKESKEIYAEPKGTASYHAIDEIFTAGSSKLTGDPYYRDAKEARQIKLLEKRFEQNPERFKKLTLKFYYMISRLDDEFWNAQPFTPSAFNSLYNRITSYQLSSDAREREGRKQVSDEDRLFEKYKDCDNPQLEYLVKMNVITREDSDYIKSRKPLEVAV